MIKRLLRLWRVFWGRCASCGAFRENHPMCPHCETDLTLCHVCGKRANYLKAFGASHESTTKYFRGSQR